MLELNTVYVTYQGYVISIASSELMHFREVAIWPVNEDGVEIDDDTQIVGRFGDSLESLIDLIDLAKSMIHSQIVNGKENKDV